MVAVLSVEVEIPSLRVLAEAEIDGSECIQSRLDQLNSIDEKHLTAICHGQLYDKSIFSHDHVKCIKYDSSLYQRRIKSTFDKRIKPRVFQEGDLVLKKRLPHDKDPRGKWSPNYEGANVLKHAFSRGALVLANSEGQELKYPDNADAVRRFYP
ncbi:hypothetical protein CR513_29200, partial [Mucuna pruriens]